MQLIARWPTGGIDPHELVHAPGAGLWVANGGVETHPETGRTKHRLDRMDSSLVRLDATSGRITGQWRLEDQRLGIRHVAFGFGGRLGVALQAEHDDSAKRRAAPVLAVWDRKRGLRAVSLPAGVALGGYGGSVAPLGHGFAVSCPRADQVACWQVAGGDAQWEAPLQLTEACALAQGWCGGVEAAVQAVARPEGEGMTCARRLSLPAVIRLDNHWTTV